MEWFPLICGANGAGLGHVSGDAFHGRCQLVTLSLASNVLTSLPDGLLDKCTALRHLDLSGNPGLASLPSNLLRRADKLQALRLADMQLRELGEAFLPDVAPQLSEVILSNNALSRVPLPFWHALVAATLLDVSGNRLSALPTSGRSAACGALPASLLELHLGHNALPSLPPNLLQCSSNLTLFSVENNRLAHLPSAFFQAAPGIESVNLASNAITALASDLFRPLVALQSLRLANNRLTTLSADLFAHNGALQ